MDITIEVQKADALKVKADVLIVKYAQELFGVDSLAYTQLAISHKNIESQLPKPDEFLLIESHGNPKADYVLFAGIGDIYKFRYKEIRSFAFNTLKHLGEIKSEIEHICITLHGVNYGLDETEAFKSEVAGIVDSIEKGFYPFSLKKVSVAELYESRANRLQNILNSLLPNGAIRGPYQPDHVHQTRTSIEHQQLITDAGINSEEKPLIFVAMPFDKKMDDIFHYGIQNAVNSAGYLCERADEIAFTGDILDLIKKRIRASSLVIADLTTTNANVYLEVGYAWGLGIPTVLIAQDPQELKFDVKGQKCIIYSGIRELEEKLGKELLSLNQRKRHGKST